MADLAQRVAGVGMAGQGDDQVQALQRGIIGIFDIEPDEGLWIKHGGDVSFQVFRPGIAARARRLRRARGDVPLSYNSSGRRFLPQDRTGAGDGRLAAFPPV